MSRSINMNFEDDKDFPVTRNALITLEKVMYEQDEYGFDKYKKALDPKDNYDWLAMFLQEIADGMKYIQCEMDNKNEVIRILQGAVTLEHADSIRKYIGFALEILTKTNTGK